MAVPTDDERKNTAYVLVTIGTAQASAGAVITINPFHLLTFRLFLVTLTNTTLSSAPGLNSLLCVSVSGSVDLVAGWRLLKV